MNLNRSHKIILVALLVARSFLAVAQTTNVVPPADYPKFIAQRNIFDPTRVPNVPWSPRPRQVYTPQPVVNQVDSFSLVGIIGYDEGRMAGVYVFFDGTSPDYHKTVQLNDNIANFKIVDISADSVTLMSDTNNTTVLRIGEQLHNDASVTGCLQTGLPHVTPMAGLAAMDLAAEGDAVIISAMATIGIITMEITMAEITEIIATATETLTGVEIIMPRRLQHPIIRRWTIKT